MSTSNALVIPGSGEVVDLDNPRECALALETIRDVESHLRELKGTLTHAIVEHARVEGRKTLSYDGVEVEVRGGEYVDYNVNAPELEEALRDLGCPEERIREAIKIEITYKVNRSVLKQLASMNEDYAAAIRAAETPMERPFSVAVRHGACSCRKGAWDPSCPRHGRDG